MTTKNATNPGHIDCYNSPISDSHKTYVVYQEGVASVYQEGVASDGEPIVSLVNASVPIIQEYPEIEDYANYASRLMLELNETRAVLRKIRRLVGTPEGGDVVESVARLVKVFNDEEEAVSHLAKLMCEQIDQDVLKIVADEANCDTAYERAMKVIK